MKINIFLAIGNQGIFGFINPEKHGRKMPWHPLPEDLKLFSEITTDKGDFYNAVIMGYTTWMSLPEKYKPLPDRVNIVISRNIGNGKDITHSDGVIFVNNMNSAFGYIQNNSFSEVFLIGGKKTVLDYLNSPAAAETLGKIYLNVISTSGVHLDQSKLIPSPDDCVHFLEILDPISSFPDLNLVFSEGRPIPCKSSHTSILHRVYTVKR
jgi:dihydrofolate reductase